MKKILKNVLTPAIAMLLLGAAQAADILSEEMFLEDAPDNSAPHLNPQQL
jgi:hypothetical protein